MPSVIVAQARDASLLVSRSSEGCTELFRRLLEDILPAGYFLRHSIHTRFSFDLILLSLLLSLFLSLSLLLSTILSLPVRSFVFLSLLHFALIFLATVHSDAFCILSLSLSLSLTHAPSATVSLGHSLITIPGTISVYFSVSVHQSVCLPVSIILSLSPAISSHLLPHFKLLFMS